MSRKLALLAGISVLASCSGGGGGVVTPADSAPTVTLTPSSASIEGGETVAITATANDTVDGTLTPSLSCNGGTLTGNLLVTAAVTADTSITCTGTATDKAGNTGTATTTISVKATVASVTSESGSTLSQGQLGAFTVANLPLTAESYAGKLGDRNITLYRGTASALNFLIPADMPAGTHRLDFQIGTRRFTYSITVTSAPTVANPKAFLTQKLGEAVATVDSLIANEGAGMSSGQRSTYLEYKSQINGLIAQLDTMSAADLQKYAALLQANIRPSASAGLVQAQFNGPACTAALGDFAAAKGNVIVMGVAGIALIFAGVDPLTKVIGLGAYLLALKELTTLGNAVGVVVTECMREPESELQAILDTVASRAKFVDALDVSSVYGFENKKSKSFRLVTTERLDDSVSEKFARGMQQLRDLAAASPHVPAGLASLITAGVVERKTNVPSSQVSLGSVSDSKIVGIKSGSGETITLTFSYVGDPPSENVPFNFTLTNGGKSIPLSGQLVVALPGAEDAAVSLIQGRPITSQLQVRGAESIEIVKAPTKGAATISTSGLLSYTPTGQAFGSDEIQYRARNANGASRTATVLLSIDRQFEGTWKINIRSTTATQSPANSCPNENRDETVFVSKVSDTQYSATYDGVPITFTMAGKDDPNGLRAQASGTFDDGPGKTTETLTINIPNSNFLDGGGSWSYVGPGVTCSGGTLVLGNR